VQGRSGRRRRTAAKNSRAAAKNGRAASAFA